MGIGKVLVVSIGTTAAALTAAAPVCAARIVDEWRPGLAESALGGDLTVDGYGVSGLGMYTVRLDDGGTALAVCVQADVGHSASAEYVAGPAATITPELDYLLWRYASAAHPATNEQAAAINVLSWWYAGAQRRGGGRCGATRPGPPSRSTSSASAGSLPSRPPWSRCVMKRPGGAARGP